MRWRSCVRPNWLSFVSACLSFQLRGTFTHPIFLLFWRRVMKRKEKVVTACLKPVLFLKKKLSVAQCTLFRIDINKSDVLTFPLFFLHCFPFPYCWVIWRSRYIYLHRCELVNRCGPIDDDTCLHCFRFFCVSARCRKWHCKIPVSLCSATVAHMYRGSGGDCGYLRRGDWMLYWGFVWGMSFFSCQQIVEAVVLFFSSRCFMSHCYTSVSLSSLFFSLYCIIVAVAL